jgi:hypothetical protein
MEDLGSSPQLKSTLALGVNIKTFLQKPEKEFRGKIRVGSQYQAEIPDLQDSNSNFFLIFNSNCSASSESDCGELIWDNYRLRPEEGFL